MPVSEDDTKIPNADPSWYPAVLRTLARDYPKISQEVWATTISENAEKLVRERNVPRQEGTPECP